MFKQEMNCTRKSQSQLFSALIKIQWIWLYTNAAWQSSCTSNPMTRRAECLWCNKSKIIRIGRSPANAISLRCCLASSVNALPPFFCTSGVVSRIASWRISNAFSTCVALISRCSNAMCSMISNQMTLTSSVGSTKVALATESCWRFNRWCTRSSIRSNSPEDKVAWWISLKSSTHCQYLGLSSSPMLLTLDIA